MKITYYMSKLSEKKEVEVSLEEEDKVKSILQPQNKETLGEIQILHF